MPRLLHRAAAALALWAVVAGCSSFLDAENATNDPNLPTQPSRDQLFMGAQANIFSQQEGPLAMIACQWMQQCAGINGRFVEQQDNYSVNASTFDIPFSEIYSAGGLVALRDIQASAGAVDDSVYVGVAQVLEALLVGTATSIWGDIPYREALAENPTPEFDPQMQIYADLQALLDEAIVNLGGAGAGPGGIDLFYGGDPDLWTEAANTLKARFHLHTAEAAGAASGPVYTAARAAALNGISDPDNDMRTAHTGVTSERNMWVQFQNTSGFGLDLVAGKRLVDLMIADNDPRLPEYFGENDLGGYGGFDVTTGTTPANQISPLAFSLRHTDEFRQPIVTWEENQLILAETNFRIAGGGAAGIAAAQPFLNAVRGARGKSTTVPATLQAIMTEKYIALFQNIEVWNDWKRTCLPVLTPARTQPEVPGRLYYGQSEEQTNPNTPRSSEQDLMTVRNANDPDPC